MEVNRWTLSKDHPETAQNHMLRLKNWAGLESLLWLYGKSKDSGVWTWAEILASRASNLDLGLGLDLCPIGFV